MSYSESVLSYIEQEAIDVNSSIDQIYKCFAKLWKEVPYVSKNVWSSRF
jgi:hypothetical protein